MEWYLAYLLLGSIAGFLAGLFGVGGGTILVPALLFFFDAQRFSPEHTMHLALGTSMAAILFTSVASAYKHHQHAAVRWDIVRGITPGILFGTLLGAALASEIPTAGLGVFFALFVYVAAGQILIGKTPDASRQLPGMQGMSLTGALTGLLSSLVSIGGGTVVVPFLLWCNVPLKNAIGTSAAIGFPVAVGGTLGYVAAGIHVAGLPQDSLGFVYLPGLLWTATASIIAAPFGAKVAHRVKTGQLRRLFALLLLVIATKLLFKVLS